MDRRCRRRERYAIRDGLRLVTPWGRDPDSRNRFRRCGKDPNGAHVGVRLDGASAGFSGLRVCGSVWICPVCGAKILSERAKETAQMLYSLARHDPVTGQRPYDLGLLTLTMSHSKGQPLAQLWDALSYAWSKVTSGRGWGDDKVTYGALEWMRAVEITYGSNGWHVHIHVLIVFDGPTSLQVGRQLAESMWSRWEAALGRKGITAVRDFAEEGKGGLHYTNADEKAQNKIGKYFSKAMADEAVYGLLKKARGQNRTPMEVARSWLEAGDEEDLAAWQEYCRAAVGRRQLTYSRGFRALADADVEKSDETIAEEDAGGADVLWLPAPSWRMLCADRQQLDLLEAGEDRGIDGLVAWLREHALPYSLEPPDEAVSPGVYRPR